MPETGSPLTFDPLSPEKVSDPYSKTKGKRNKIILKSSAYAHPKVAEERSSYIYDIHNALSPILCKI